MFAAGFRTQGNPEIPLTRVGRLYRKALRVGIKNYCFMKKIIFLLAASLLCFQLGGFAQTRVGVAAGVSLANMRGSGVDGNTKAGAYVSLVLDKPICGNFSFHPTLSYVQKGISVPEPTLLLEKTNTALRYIEFTPNFLFNLNGNTASTFFVGVGPTICFDLPSKRTDYAKDEATPKSTKTILFGREVTNDMKGFDYGANAIAGFRMANGFFISANYNLGLRNLVTDGKTGDLKNMYFGIQLGAYLENGRKK